MVRILLHLFLLAVMTSLVAANIGSGGGGGEQAEILAEYPNQPMVFNTPEELRTYLQELDKYFAIVGRPRFGRTVGNGYSKSVYPYYRGNPFPPSF